MENDVRYDEFTGRLVLIARGRRKRPHFYRGEAEEDTGGCPFCPGHESETPKATLLYVMEDKKGILKTFDRDDNRRSDWSVRVFPNMYPALSTETPFSLRSLNAYGYHEVVVENPDHFWRYETADPRSIELPLSALVDRGRLIESDGNIRYVAIFKNQGREAGASVAHFHYQIMGSTFVPPLVSKEVDAFLKHYSSGEQCYFCTLSSSAKDDGRLVLAKEHFAVMTPFASIFPYECWIVPRHHISSFLESSADEISDLAVTIKELFSAYRSVLGSFSFNMVFHSRPVGTREFHWHLEIYPRVAVHAGFELGSGAYINAVEPEEAALQLRQFLPTCEGV
jgi:UDPglucose--hexose-1-phosphate uridylyltransferase